MKNERSISDEMAINWIADIISEKKPKFDIIDRISQIIQFTGRDIIFNNQDSNND
jgi:hypothetical protein